MTLKNPYPQQEKTHERQRGGNTPAVGEKHDGDSKKAERIPESKRWDRDAQKIEAPE